MPNVVLARNTYLDQAALRNVIAYALRGAMAGGYGITPEPERALEEMLFVKRAFYKTEGVQLKHFFITFSHKEALFMDFGEMMQLAFEVGKLFEEYQMVYGLHLDGSHVHVHIVMNTTSFMDGHQYSDGLNMFMKLCGMLKRMFPDFPVHLCQSRKFTKDEPFSDADREDYQILASL